jgi:hypothetical protein
MGDPEAATGAAGPTGKVQEAEGVGSRFESHPSGREETLGSLPQSSQVRGIGGSLETCGEVLAALPDCMHRHDWAPVSS